MEAESTLTAGSIAFRLAIVVLLVAANGFFVAAEFALVSARRTRIEAEAAKGNRRARLAKGAIDHLDHYISGTQLGITLASLGLGWVGESTLAAILIQAFDGLGDPWNIVASHAVAIPISFAVITVLHIVLGELAPKSLALLFPERVSLWTAGPLILFSRVLTPSSPSSTARPTCCSVPWGCARRRRSSGCTGPRRSRCSSRRCTSTAPSPKSRSR
jgi:CBS domain containing-hemolysin-like protein